MKKILLSLAMIAMVGAVAVGATRAYFTDQAIVNDNSFTAGKLNFTLNGDMTETKSLTLTNMEPGVWYGPYKMQIYNQNLPVSTMDIKYKFAPKFESQTVGGFYEKLNAKVEHGNCMSTPSGISPVTHTEQGALASIAWDSPTMSIGSGKLSPNITHCFAWYFQLDPTAGNVFQGANAVVDVVVDGTQFINPGWAE